MKIVIAPDSYKESLTALEVADAIEKGWREVYPDATYIKIPMADGGEGTVRSLVDATGGEIITKQVTGPLGQPVQAFYGVLGDRKTAVIEMAAASGLHLVPREQRNPLFTTTRGTGELILAALDHGVEHIIIGIGGSATNDGGAGMAQALGAKLLDNKGKDIGYGGEELAKLDRIDISGLDSRLKYIKIEVACDVNNPLIGPMGASAIYGPQKGATPEIVTVLDQNLAHYAHLIARDLGKEVKDIPGAGAAGGLGAGLLAFTPASLKKGIDIVLSTTKLSEHVQDANLVITGEGQIDGQTVFGKTPSGVAKVAKQYHVPVIGIAGSLGHNHQVVYEHGIDALFSIVPGIISLHDALDNASNYVFQTARNIAMVWNLSQLD